jgi:hypothetical protein
MKDSMRMASKRPARLLGVCVLLAGGIASAALFSAGTAQAAACGPPTVAGTPCTLTGTLAITGGTLTLTSPTALAWAATITGSDQQVVDTTVAHQSFTVNDATGSGAGWHITVAATQFTTGTLTLPNIGTFVTTGSTTSEAATTAPNTFCSSGSTCTPPTNTTTYPVAITTAATAPAPVTIFTASVNTGLGSNLLGNGNNFGWWLNLPASVRAGTYTSTVSLHIISGP